ncbi:MAG TPA: prepilin-type N-terminal cleavage/methylation domain-containing protein [Rickettsiales bacterium]|nr:prepilin-type N-terminal cleavage/methylation domain-containing protein [Rickettsiales bacterium]
MKSGFTLIELSIVLVIIGLIVGGILTGQDLIDAATARAQLSQIEKYQTAVRTFQGKFGYFPGDIPEPYATQFGLQARGAYAGQGDGNGVLEGTCSDTSNDNAGDHEGSGELAAFWADLSKAALLDTTILGADNGGAGYPSTHAVSPNVTLTTTPPLSGWLPTAKVGNGNFVYVYALNSTSTNYFAISTVTKLGCTIESTSSPGMTVQQSYMIDKKADDGLPQTGSIVACYVNYDIVNFAIIWAANGTTGAGTNGCIPASSATVTNYATTNCYDNNGVAGTETYSTSRNATSRNCALSFKFQ